MDSLQVSLLVFGIVLIVGTQMGSAIHCVECNSHFDADCEDIPDDFRNRLPKENLVDCDTKDRIDGRNYTMCRKMKQHVEGDGRTIRLCAAHGETRCIERTGTKNVKLSYCTCDGDYCNNAPVIFSFNKMILLSVISAILALISYS